MRKTETTGASRTPFSPVRLAWSSLFVVMLAGLRAHAQWEPHPEISLKEIAVGSTTQVVGIKANQEIWRYFGGKTWMRMPGAATKVAIAADGTLWALNSAGTLSSWGQADWVARPPPTSTPTSVAVGSAGSVWISTSQDIALQWNGREWRAAPGLVGNVAVSTNGMTTSVDSHGNALLFNASTQSWMPYLPCKSSGPRNCIGQAVTWAYGRPGSGKTLLLAEDGTLNILDSSPGTWRTAPGTLVSVSAGDDGRVYWALETSGRLLSGAPTAPSVFDPLPKNESGFPKVRFWNQAAGAFLGTDATPDGGSETLTLNMDATSMYTLQPTFTDLTTFRLHNGASNACPYRHQSETGTVHHWSCGSDSAMEFSLIPVTEGLPAGAVPDSVYVRSTANNRCIRFADGTVVDGNCEGAAAIFRLVPVR